MIDFPPIWLAALQTEPESDAWIAQAHDYWAEAPYVVVSHFCRSFTMTDQCMGPFFFVVVDDTLENNRRNETPSSYLQRQPE
jgi:hypothetical protein